MRNEFDKTVLDINDASLIGEKLIKTGSVLFFYRFDQEDVRRIFIARNYAMLGANRHDGKAKDNIIIAIIGLSSCIFNAAIQYEFSYFCRNLKLTSYEAVKLAMLYNALVMENTYSV